MAKLLQARVTFPDSVSHQFYVRVSKENIDYLREFWEAYGYRDMRMQDLLAGIVELWVRDQKKDTRGE